MGSVIRYRVREGTDPVRMLAGLEARAHLEREARLDVDRVVYETFDWRFLAEDSILEHRTSADGAHLVWRSLSSGDVLGQLAVDAVPTFVWHLPYTPVVGRLERVTDVRALMPLVTLHSSFDSRRLVDGEGKTLARLTLERTSVDKGRELPAVLELTPVRGYAANTEALARLLSAQVGLVPEPDDPVMIALRSAGFAPGSYSSKLRLALDPTDSAHHAWITVLRGIVRDDAGERGGSS